jgi:uncharacterized membrane protein
MKLSWRIEALQLAILAAMFVAAAACWPYAPERMPIHWNIEGQPDGYGGKFVGLLLLPLVALGVYLLTLVLPRFDPLSTNYQKFATAYGVIRIAIVALLAAIYAVTVLAALGYQVNVTVVAAWSMAVLFIVLGLVLPRIEPNWFVGVRTPWTLSSKLSWTKTHRLAGKLFMGMGAAMALWGLRPARWSFFLMLAVVGVSVVWILVYSYVVFRHDPDRATKPINSQAAG